MSNDTKVAKFNKRLENLRSARSDFMPWWGELSDYHLAHRGKFLMGDSDKALRRNTKQINNTSRLASRTLASGMMAGITSPARPWFKLATADPKLKEHAAVKRWLHAVEVIMYRVYSQSNTYNSLHSLYAEIGVFGTGAMGVYQDFENVIRCKQYTVGSYMLGVNGIDRVDTMYREYQQTVGQLVKKFGIDKVSDSVKQQWENGNTESWIDCVHAVEPNDDRDHMSPFAGDMPFRSVYYEKSKGNTEDGFLKESGFEDFPIMAPRWDVVGEGVYSSDCPGMVVLGDTKALQLGEKRKYQAVDKVSNPPLLTSAGLKNKTKGQTPQPGEMIYGGSAGSDDTISSIYGNYRPDINAIRDVNFEAEGRIKRGFYEDLFLMMINNNKRQPITATEVAEKQEEKLLMLGPVLERLHDELLDPLVDRTFNILQRAGILPPPPQELQDSKLAIEYVSVLAQAQRMVAVSGLRQTVSFAAEVAQVWPEARHKINATETVDAFSEAMGTDPNIIRSDDEVGEIMAGEAQAKQAAQESAQAVQQIETTKTASEIDTGGENAVTEVMRQAGLK